MIGINYRLDLNSRLTGCVNDVKNMARYLRDVQGFSRDDIKIVTDEFIRDLHMVTYDGIIQLLYELCISSWKDQLDLAVFHYSGHGGQQEDNNGDEVDHMDEGLVPVDFASRGLILDDMLSKIFRMFNPKTKVITFVDACHSGTILDLSYSPVPIICISGCRDNQTSADIGGSLFQQAGGAMTTCLLKLLTERGKAVYYVDDLINDLNDLLGKRGYDQRSELTYTIKPLVLF